MTPDDIRTWLHERLASLLDMPLEDIAAADSVAELGADSLTVARLTEELREKTRVDLPATLFYDTANFADLISRIAASVRSAMAAASAAAPPRRIVLAASFTIEPIEASLAALLEASELNATLSFAPYHQILQQLLDPAVGFGRQDAAAHVVLLRLEDWFRHAGATPELADIEPVVGQLAAALQAARARLSGPILAVLCPHGDGAAMQAADCALMTAIAMIAGVELVDLRGQGGAHDDPVRDRIGHIPYTQAGYAALALGLGRVLHGCLTQPAKVLVVDCDNTLWGGVVGEDGASGVTIAPGHRALQAFLLRRKQAGQLITLASKNAEADVWTVFDSRADMLLSRADIAAWRIDWQPKADNIHALADELALGLDSFIFLDDSPAECAAVAAALPEVTVVQLPGDAAAFEAFLAAHWAFDQNLGRYGLWRPDYAPRISAVPGALDQPRLGMRDACFDRYAAEVDAVIHNGAAVNFIFPFSHLRGANIDGTVEAMRFAAAHSSKPFHFISTLGVLMSGYARDHVILEDEELDRSEDLPNGYEQTKWVADKIVWKAIQAGYPASIYRLGMLSGLAESGVYHKLNEFLPSFLKGCIQLGSFPHMDSKVEMVPIDVTVRTLARLIGTPACLRKVFHMNHPDPLDDAEYVEAIRRLGYPIRHVPFDIWKRELIGSGSLKTNALYPFLDFIRGLQAHQTRIPDMNMANTFAVAAEEILACPDQATLLRRYFGYFAAVNYLPAPQHRAIPGVHAEAAE